MCGRINLSHRQALKRESHLVEAVLRLGLDHLLQQILQNQQRLEMMLVAVFAGGENIIGLGTPSRARLLKYCGPVGCDWEYYYSHS